MKNLILLIAFFATPAVFTLHPSVLMAQEAVANVSKEFELRASLDETVKWAESHKEAIQNAMNIVVLEDLGKGKFKVKRESPKGEFIWILQETTGTTSTGKYVYKAQLVESISGGMVYSDTYVIISAAERGGTLVSIRLKAGINNPEVRTRAMTIDCVNRINKCRRIMEEALN